MPFFTLAASLLVALAAPAPAAAATPAPAPAAAAPSARRAYAEGQVWHYRTRPGEKRSVVAIRRVEIVPERGAQGPVYHVSLVGLKMGGFGSVLPHVPVSRETLDASVTRLAKGHRKLPPFEEGVARWRSAKGGVFTLDLAGIVDATQKLLAGAALPE